MIVNLLLVGLGGAAGSILRYGLMRFLNTSFPWGTLVVNITGCLLIGILWGSLVKGMDEQKRLLLVTGFCGGFTTFSAFTQEGVQMLLENRMFIFAFYTGISIVAGLLATFIGFKLSTLFQ